MVSGPCGNWKACQVTHSKDIASIVAIVEWHEETGTIVVPTVNLNTMTVTTFAGFPRGFLTIPVLLTAGKKTPLRRQKCRANYASNIPVPSTC